MPSNIKPVRDLTIAEEKIVIDLQQKSAALRQIQANAQTALANAQGIYETAMQRAKDANEPALISARATFSITDNKCRQELATIEESLRAIRAVEL